MFQLAGDEIEELPDIGGVVGSAHGAIADSLGHLAGGGSPADGYVTSRMGNIKPAIDAVGKVAARSGSQARRSGSPPPAKTAASQPASRS